LSGGAYEGWRYASRAEVGALFDSLWGGTVDGWHNSNRDGGNWVAANLGSVFDSYGYGTGGMDFHFGTNAEVVTASYFGHYRGGGTGTDGWFSNYYGLGTGTDAIDYQVETSKSVAGWSWGHALVMEASAPVPEPASIAMWGVGALGMAFARRKRKMQTLAV
jgi:hypothetical protein